MQDIITNEQLMLVGQHLAYWSDYYHRIIKVDELPINIEGPNAGGYSRVRWQHTIVSGVFSRDERSAKLRENKEVRENLKQLINKRGCHLNEILEYVKQFQDPLNRSTNVNVWDEQAFKNATPERLAKKLGCLGKVKFKKVFHGIK
ncbi:MAG TPA: hypothetical protein VJ464_09450 [Blastocatellia bacterium]|nr:hypothetical protein [Blastocatellia bacterium]